MKSSAAGAGMSTAMRAGTCVEWQAARAARARAIAAWASDTMSLRRNGISSSIVAFVGFGADACVAASDAAD